jgi:alkylhydroperoxidase family enzyme
LPPTLEPNALGKTISIRNGSDFRFGEEQAPWHLRWFYGAMRKMFGKDLTPAKVQMRLPGLIWGGVAMEAALGRKRLVSLRYIQLGKIRAAARIGCPFWIDINSAVGRKAGLSDEKLRAVLGQDMTDTPAKVSDDLYTRLRNQFSEEQLMQLGAQIAFENYRARWNRIFNVESDNLYQGTTAS